MRGAVAVLCVGCLSCATVSGSRAGAEEEARVEGELLESLVKQHGQAQRGRIERGLKQLASLERRRGRQGRDAVDAPPRQHEDVANAAAGALVLAAEPVDDVATIEVFWG